MSLISFSTGIYFVRPELEQPLIQLPCSPIEPILPGQYHSLTTLVYRSRLNTHFGYELSPSPNDAKFTPRRNVGESRFTSNDFQNNSPFAGISPWPVVEATKIVNVCDLSDSYNLHYCQLMRGSLARGEGGGGKLGGLVRSTHRFEVVHLRNLGHEM